MKATTTVNTLYNRIQLKKLKINKYQTKQLGQYVKDLYVSKYHELPKKTVINLVSQKGDSLIRTVAIYPDEFLPAMDRVIAAYAQKLQKAETQNQIK